MGQDAPCRLLVVDDARDTGPLFSVTLGGRGYEVVYASTAAQGLALFSQETFDVAFVDDAVGTRDGLELLNQLRQRDPDISLVPMTAVATVDSTLRALNVSSVDYLVKPFSPERLQSSAARGRASRHLIRRNQQLLKDLTVIRDDLEEKIHLGTAALLDTIQDLKASYRDTVHGLAMTIEARDRYTRGHSERLGGFAMGAGRELRLSKGEMDILENYSVLHDIGKIGIPGRILNKPDRLETTEREVMMTHPIIGSEIVDRIQSLAKARPIVRNHHERFDGTGYPDRLKGEEIPIVVRVVTVVDSYDAMTSDRPYRRGLTTQAALAELSNGSGSQFDPAVAEAFSRYLRAGGDANGNGHEKK